MTGRKRSDTRPALAGETPKQPISCRECGGAIRRDGLSFCGQACREVSFARYQIEHKLKAKSKRGLPPELLAAVHHDA